MLVALNILAGILTVMMITTCVYVCRDVENTRSREEFSL